MKQKDREMKDKDKKLGDMDKKVMDIDKKFSGKKPDDLLKELEKLRKLLSEKDKEIAKLQRKNEDQ